MIDRNEIDRICTLARLGLSEDEKSSLQQDVGKILQYVNAIESIDVPDEVVPQYDTTNIVREDDNVYETGMWTDDVLREAPHTEDGYIRVQSILSHDE